MIHENVELHNVTALQSVEGRPGLRLQRVPEKVRLALNESAQMRMLQPDNIEIRFVSDSPTCRITLSSEGQTRVTIFNGLLDSLQRFIIGPQPQTIELLLNERLQQLDQTYWEHMSFSPQVWRIILGGPQRDPIFFHNVEGSGIRPPKPNEIPSLRYLAYGTSITHGFVAEGPQLTYASQTARRLGADLINLGVGGAAHCEPELADYIASRDDWHIASLALSVNMGGFELPEFHQRVGYMVNTVAGADPNRPVACVTLYPHFRDWGIALNDPGFKAQAQEYRQVLRDVVRDCPHKNTHLIEGPDILTDISGLSGDLIHPSDNGMIEMGQRLAEKLKPLLPD